VPLDYKQWHEVDEGLSIRLQQAGHILGSAYVECKTLSLGRVVFSGDLGAPHTPLLPGPKPPYACDVLVIESTYGNRNHEARAQRVAQLKGVLKKCFENGGTVLIPAFSLGRTQELMYELEAVLRSRQFEGAPALRVVVDSPLAAKFNEAYRQLKPYWDAEAHKRLRSGRHPLSFEELITVDDHESHMAFVEKVSMDCRASMAKAGVGTKGVGTVVLAASGMCAGGRVVNYLKALLGDKRNDVLFVGYQAAGTPGRDILRYGNKPDGYVEFEGQRYDIKAGIHALTGYSAHAGQRDLVNFVKRMRRKPKEVRIIHGDAGAKAALAGLLAEVVPGAKVWVP
jgi:metallo-beta-lactamase family protein